MINKTNEKVEKMKNNKLIKIEDISIFRKILNFFKNIFYKNEQMKEYNSNSQKTKQENNVINELKAKRIITDLQKQYEDSAIKEKDLTEEEKEKLIELYKDQISTIENNIATKLKELEFYKQKIMAAKEQRDDTSYKNSSTNGNI